MKSRAEADRSRSQALPGNALLARLRLARQSLVGIGFPGRAWEPGKTHSRAQLFSRRAFTLVEILVVMAALVVVLGFGISLLAAGMRIWHASASAQNQWNHRQTLADRFREDVHQATATPERAEGWTAGPTCLILRQAGGGAIVYHWTKGRLERSKLPSAQTQELRCGPEGTTVEFVRPANRRLVAMQLKHPLDGGGSRLHQISAALGGDLR